MSLLSRSTSLIASLTAIAAIGLVAPIAHANLLTNAGFEDPVLGPDAEAAGAAGWTPFNGVFTQDTALLGPGSNSGSQHLKMFGTAGVFQDFAINPGETANGSVLVLDDSTDSLGDAQVAALNIEWLTAGGTSSTITPFISNGTFSGFTSTQDTWTEITITGVAPADAVTARFLLITGPFQPENGDGGAGGAAFYDDAFFEIVPEPSSLALLSLGGLAMLRRRRN